MRRRACQFVIACLLLASMAGLVVTSSHHTHGIQQPESCCLSGHQDTHRGHAHTCCHREGHEVCTAARCDLAAASVEPIEQGPCLACLLSHIAKGARTLAVRLPDVPVPVTSADIVYRRSLPARIPAGHRYSRAPPEHLSI